MHRYRIVARIFLILFTLNLVFAAPVVVQKMHEARGDDMVVGESSHDGVSGASHDATASPQHSSDGSTSSGHLTQHVESGSSESGHSWMLDRPPGLSPSRPPPPSRETHPDDAKFLNKNNVLKLKMLAGVIVIATAVTGVMVGTSHNHRDFEDSST
jgi:hypothetical protein